MRRTGGTGARPDRTGAIRAVAGSLESPSTTVNGEHVSATPANRRWMGVGRCDATDSRTAALSAARSALVGAEPRLLVAFAAIDHDPAAVLDGLGAAAPGGAATLAPEAPLAVAVRHGYRRVGEPMIVTSSGNGRVYTLDDRPALDVYLDRLGAPAEAYVDPAAFTSFALSRPLGVQRRSGVEARNLSTEVDLGGRSIGGGGAIDHGGLTWAMTGDEESILAATDAACQDALAGLDGAPPVGLLTLSCDALPAV